MKTILLKLSGPLQSWGTSSHFEKRYTDYYPSKSAVIGMIAAACGFRRDEDDNIKQLDSLSFGIRIDQPGKILNDLQIAQKDSVKKTNQHTYKTERHYLSDAVFVVAIGSNDNTLIQNIFSKLHFPYFQLYLGRRSLPINSDYLINDHPLNIDIIDSLKKERWHAANWYQYKYFNKNFKNENKKLDVWADNDLVKDKYYQMVKDVPKSFSRGRTKSSLNHFYKRTYDFRPVGHISINVPLNIKK